MLLRCSFQEAVRPVVEALVSSHWFAALPGPARVITLDTVLRCMVRATPSAHVRGAHTLLI